MSQAAPLRARGRLLPQPRPAAVGAAALPAHHRRDRRTIYDDPPGRTAATTTSARPARTRSPGFARATYFFGEGDFRTYVAGDRGARHDPPRRHVRVADPSCGSEQNTTCVDTVPSGPVFVGAGAGIMYNVTPGVRADPRDQRAARLHEVHVQRRPERRRRVRVLAARGRARPLGLLGFPERLGLAVEARGVAAHHEQRVGQAVDVGERPARRSARRRAGGRRWRSARRQTVRAR